MYWQEDIAELTAVIDELEENRRQLEERNYIAQENYETQRRIISLREKNEFVEFGELSRCIAESLTYLELMGVSCGCDIELNEALRTKDALRAYHTFESIIEAALNSLRFLWLKAKTDAEHISLYIEAECDTDLSALSEIADDFSVEDGIYRFAARLEKGGEAA